MFTRFSGAKITCDKCEEEKEYKVSSSVNITKQDQMFETRLKEKGWLEISDNLHLCPKCAKEYKQTDNKENWIDKNTDYYV